MTDQHPVAIVGAGLSGAVIARALAEAGHQVDVYEARDHVAGNCHTERDAGTGVMVHRYGPHIFHTSDQQVWDYVNRFARFKPYHHRVRTTAGNTVYSLPVNLSTINQLYGLSLNEDEARAHVAGRCDSSITDPQNFEEQALATIGPDLYEAFFKGYTQKQWGCSPRDLPASILKRLPLRFTDDDAYFDHRFQGLPSNGYTAMVAEMLDFPGITVHLNTRADITGSDITRHMFWSGSLDGYFGYSLGRLGYRTLDFENFAAEGDFQGCPVMNYGDLDVPYTRITEHKHFAPWESHAKTLCSREFSRACGPDDIPYYPIRLVHEKALLADYVKLANRTPGVTFVGRLGTYRYLDMDVCIREALNAADSFHAACKNGDSLPAFLTPPL